MTTSATLIFNNKMDFSYYIFLFSADTKRKQTIALSMPRLCGKIEAEQPVYQYTMS